VVENKLERWSAQWVPIDDSEVSFLQLMEEQLRSITFGVYQLKLSSSYIQEYMDGESRICVHKELFVYIYTAVGDPIIRGSGLEFL
jgi:hypothetical protein